MIRLKKGSFKGENIAVTSKPNHRWVGSGKWMVDAKLIRSDQLVLLLDEDAATTHFTQVRRYLMVEPSDLKHSVKSMIEGGRIVQWTRLPWIHTPHDKKASRAYQVNDPDAYGDYTHIDVRFDELLRAEEDSWWGPEHGRCLFNHADPEQATKFVCALVGCDNPPKGAAR